jgi:hypothetical protein
MLNRLTAPELLSCAVCAAQDYNERETGIHGMRGTRAHAWSSAHREVLTEAVVWRVFGKPCVLTEAELVSRALCTAHRTTNGELVSNGC